MFTEAYNILDYLFYHYQTIVGAFMTSAAAILTILYLHGENIKKDRRRLRGARAVMPATLSRLMLKLNNDIKNLYQLRYVLAADVARQQFSEMPRIELETTDYDRLSQLVEATNKSNANVIADFFRSLQVHDSRYSELPVDQLMDQDDYIDNLILYAAELRATIGNIFAFVDKDAVSISETVTFEDVRSGLRLNGIRQHDAPGVYAKLERRHRASRLPTEE